MKKSSENLFSGTLALIMSAMFLTLGAETLPQIESLTEFRGVAPDFVRITESSGRFGGRTIHFAESQGTNCVFSGPRYGEVKRALRVDASVRILCDTRSVFWNPPIVYEIEIDGHRLVTFDDVVDFRRTDIGIGIWFGLFLLVLGIGLMVQGRRLRGRGL